MLKKISKSTSQTRSKGIVVIVSQNNFPCEDAGALRNEVFARIYQRLGYDPILICRNPNEKQGVYESIPFFSHYVDVKIKPSFLRKGINYVLYVLKMRQIIRHISRNYDVELVHIYHDLSFLWYRFAAQKKIQVVKEVVEWYTHKQTRLGFFEPTYLLKSYINRIRVNKKVKVIAISRFLEEYFKGKNIKCLRVPAILEVSSDAPKKHERDKIKIAYCGHFSLVRSKDCVLEVIDAFLDSEIENNKLELHLIGVEKAMIEQSKLIRKERLNNSKNADHIFFYGRLPHSEASRLLEEMDFSILVRPSQAVYARAGFPTKVVEASSSGVAMICNLTSDLDVYLKDDENAIILVDESKCSLQKVFQKVNKLSFEEILKLRINAKRTALQFFDYRSYIQSVKDFIDK